MERESGYYCCFIKARKEGDQKTVCSLLIDEEYDNLREYKENIISAGYDDVSVICEISSTSSNYSNYLQLGISSFY